MSQHTELHQFMNNLYQAGMSIESVVQSGFEFAYNHNFEVGMDSSERIPVVGSQIRLEASQAVLAVANELGISLKQQIAASREGHQQGWIVPFAYEEGKG